VVQLTRKQVEQFLVWVRLHQSWRMTWDQDLQRYWSTFWAVAEDPQFHLDLNLKNRGLSHWLKNSVTSFNKNFMVGYFANKVSLSVQLPKAFKITKLGLYRIDYYFSRNSNKFHLKQKICKARFALIQTLSRHFCHVKCVTIIWGLNFLLEMVQDLLMFFLTSAVNGTKSLAFPFLFFFKPRFR